MAERSTIVDTLYENRVAAADTKLNQQKQVTPRG